MKILGWISWLLLVIGGLNWGLIGLVNINLVSMLFGAGSGIERIVYIIVGAAAVLSLFCCKKSCSSGSCK